MKYPTEDGAQTVYAARFLEMIACELAGAPGDAWQVFYELSRVVSGEIRTTADLAARHAGWGGNIWATRLSRSPLIDEEAFALLGGFCGWDAGRYTTLRRITRELCRGT